MEKWTISNKIFNNEEQNTKALIVLQDIVDEFCKLIPNGPPMGFKTIEIIEDKVSGPTFYWPLGRDTYKIGLNVSDVNYNQLAFQFAQELCRIYCDPRINSWFIELLCHITALYTLDFLGQKWEINPPNEELKDYWYNFDSYKSNLLGAAFSKVDMVKYQVANEWLQYQVNKLKKNDKVNRGKLLIIAYELLPLFKKMPESWQMLPEVGRSSVPPPPEDPTSLITNRNTEPGFDKLLDYIPDNVKSFISQFYDKIGAREFI
jgi:hypothetical protein